jgi:ABC-type spermidine/putrescine transport system permease subunit I
MIKKRSITCLLAIVFVIALASFVIADNIVASSSVIFSTGSTSSDVDWNSITLVCVAILLLIAAYLLVRKRRVRKAKIKAKKKKKL